MFSRSDEYVFFVLLGEARVLASTDDMLSDASAAPRFDVRWDSLRRRGLASRRSRIPSLFYPIYFDADSGAFVKVGTPLPNGVSAAEELAGLDAVLPVAPDGSEMTWSLSPEGFMDRLGKGYVRYYRDKSGEYVIRFIQEGTIRAIERGDVAKVGEDKHGFPTWGFVNARRMTPMTTWRRPSHSASDYGTPMLTALVPWGRAFPYPKSLYAVEDALRFFIGDKPDAVVLDFFSGSGTTAHAVMRLNKQDDGRRQCISVTNNEVSADEQVALRKMGLRPGDSEWEQWGICDHITKPRIRAAITGETPEGVPIKGDYKFIDEFPIAEGFGENAAFFTLTYESPWMVGNDRAFAAIAPMLWLRAGARGARIDTIEGGWAVTDHYGILRDLDQTVEFVEALNERDGVRIVYVVTDDEGRYQQVANEMPHTETVRLYEDYLRNCESTGDL